MFQKGRMGWFPGRRGAQVPFVTEGESRWPQKGQEFGVASDYPALNPSLTWTEGWHVQTGKAPHPSL